MRHGILVGMRTKSPKRVFLGPIEIAGYFRGLEIGLQELGVDARRFDTSGDPFRYGRTREWRARIPPAVAGRLGSNPVLRRLARGASRIAVLCYSLFAFDTFILGGNGFLWGWELPLLRRLGKRTIWVFLGSDHRPPYLNGKAVLAGTAPRDLASESRRIASKVQRIERWADIVVAHDASAQFHRRPFVRLLEIGIPLVVDTIPGGQPAEATDSARPVVLLHCPTDPVAKGSVEIRRVIGNLIADGASISLRELTGRPHAEVLTALDNADIAIDELYSDTPMGVFSAEASWLGTARVCCGYFEVDGGSLLSPGARPPGEYVLPDAFERTLRELIADRSKREALGSTSQTFVREHWSPQQVAARYVALLTRSGAPHFWLDPARVSYIDGYGMRRDVRRRAIRALLDATGPEGLSLGHRPDLVERLIEDSAMPGPSDQVDRVLR
jgi:glycosyltransferase involved in cell wall biosynthesis